MKTIYHKSDSRGFANHGWLKSYHTFSFASYFNPERMGFGTLRVINDDTVAPKMGFGTHPHNNMEIITVPLSGALRHKDSMGNEFVIKKGEVQAMSAGTGITHSEFNASDSEEVSLLQIWVKTREKDIEPNYSQKQFDLAKRKNSLQLIVSPDGREGSTLIHQDAYFSLCDLDKGKNIAYTKKKKDNILYLFVIEGKLKVSDKELSSRDGLGITEFDSLEISAQMNSEILLMEVPR
mgnify:CR=1 FL=1